ncbi:CHASE4 domain-containing protein [Rhizobium ruizarguesonis]|uniref:CHASE4 domain-containing protein n=1 Tax=Rhizobium ruizarguesonis TaxID=2081791 RepID=UPI001FD2C8D0|nr:CHASE4 domain-containing protein [Rhizobium ruizarguesonis]
MQSAVAHDQESATVWDDAVVKTKERDLDWLDANLGRWMNTYFGHDAAIVLSADGQTIYQFVADSAKGLSPEDLRSAYSPLATALADRSHVKVGAGDRIFQLASFRAGDERPARDPTGRRPLRHCYIHCR